MRYHLGEEPNISRLEPRPAPDPSSGQTGPMVWAIDDAHLHNYLLPRNCPRVAFYAAPNSHPDDVARLLRQTLYLYRFSPEPFLMIDADAGYYIAHQPVMPESVREITDLPAELFARNVELRVLPSLWKLRDVVAASSLQFSMIRMRNAGPRTV